MEEDFFGLCGNARGPGSTNDNSQKEETSFSKFNKLRGGVGKSTPLLLRERRIESEFEIIPASIDDALPSACAFAQTIYTGKIVASIVPQVSIGLLTPWERYPVRVIATNEQPYQPSDAMTF